MTEQLQWVETLVMGGSWQAVCINKTSTTTLLLAQYSSTYDKLKSGTQHVTRSAKNHKVEQSYVYEACLGIASAS